MKIDGKYDLPTIEAWDRTIEKTSGEFEHLMHNLIWYLYLDHRDSCESNVLCCSQNCHSHVARVLNRMKFKKFHGWNTFFLILFMLFYGQSVRYLHFPQTTVF